MLSNISLATKGPTWRKPWNLQRLRWKSGSRTAGIKPNEGRWYASSRSRRGKRSRCWWGIMEPVSRPSEWASQWHCQCTRPTSTTRARTTGASHSAWTWWRAEVCSDVDLKAWICKTAQGQDSAIVDALTYILTIYFNVTANFKRYKY